MYAGIRLSEGTNYTCRDRVANGVRVITHVGVGVTSLSEDHDPHKQSIYGSSLPGRITYRCSNPHLYSADITITLSPLLVQTS